MCFFKKKDNAMTYKSFDRYSKDALKAQIAASFKLGVTAAPMSVSMINEKKKHEEQVKAMTATLVIFADFSPNRRLVRQIKERIEQENQWIKHYTKCEEEYKKGLERIRAALKNVDMKVTIEMIVQDDAEKRKAAAAVVKKEKDKPIETGTPMLARQFSPTTQQMFLTKKQKRELKQERKKKWKLFAVRD